MRDRAAARSSAELGRAFRLHRRRCRDGLAAAGDRARRARLRAHRRGRAGLRIAGRSTATPTCWRPACPASSPAATSASRWSSASPRRSARAAWRSPSSTSSCARRSAPSGLSFSLPARSRAMKVQSPVRQAHERVLPRDDLPFAGVTARDTYSLIIAWPTSTGRRRSVAETYACMIPRRRRGTRRARLEARELIGGHLLAHRRATLDLDAGPTPPTTARVMGGQPLRVVLVEGPLVLGDDRPDLPAVGVTVRHRAILRRPTGAGLRDLVGRRHRVPGSPGVDVIRTAGCPSRSCLRDRAVVGDPRGVALGRLREPDRPSGAAAMSCGPTLVSGTR